jgi:hypothetical protein
MRTVWLDFHLDFVPAIFSICNGHVQKKASGKTTLKKGRKKQIIGSRQQLARVGSELNHRMPALGKEVGNS